MNRIILGSYRIVKIPEIVKSNKVKMMKSIHGTPRFKLLFD